MSEENVGQRYIDACKSTGAKTAIVDLAALDALVAERDELRGLAEWLVSLDDPEDVLGREERRTVTLTQIIDRARKVLAA